MSETTVADKIQDNAKGPKKITVDGLSVEQHSIDDQIKADKYLAAKTAASSTRLGIKLNKMVPPGAV